MGWSRRGVVDGVVIARCDGGDGEANEEKVRPRNRRMPKQVPPRSMPHEAVKAEKSNDVDKPMDDGVIGHFRRAGENRLAYIRIGFDKEHPAPREFPQAQYEKMPAADRQNLWEDMG